MPGITFLLPRSAKGRMHIAEKAAKGLHPIVRANRSLCGRDVMGWDLAALYITREIPTCRACACAWRRREGAL